MIKELWCFIIIIPLALGTSVYGLLRWQTLPTVPIQYLVFGISCLMLIAVGAMLTLLIDLIVICKED